jgi:hypothetical protein
VDDMNENEGIINFIMLARVYDMLMLIADAQGKGKEALKLYEMHSQGQLMSPWPSLVQADSVNPESLSEQTQDL